MSDPTAVYGIPGRLRGGESLLLRHRRARLPAPRRPLRAAEGRAMTWESRYDNDELSADEPQDDDEREEREIERAEVEVDEE